jgi:hypothetical protein
MHTRRAFPKIAGLAGARHALGQTTAASSAKFVNAPILCIAYEESGTAQGIPIILLHGFPDDIYAWDDVTPPLVKAGYRTLVPYLRGTDPRVSAIRQARAWRNRVIKPQHGLQVRVEQGLQIVDATDRDPAFDRILRFLGWKALCLVGR